MHPINRNLWELIIRTAADLWLQNAEKGSPANVNLTGIDRHPAVSSTGRFGHLEAAELAVMSGAAEDWYVPKNLLSYGRLLLGYPQQRSLGEHALTRAASVLFAAMGPLARFYLVPMWDANAGYAGSAGTYPIDRLEMTLHQMAGGQPGSFAWGRYAPPPVFLYGDIERLHEGLPPEDRPEGHLSTILHEFGHAFFNPLLHSGGRIREFLLGQISPQEFMRDVIRRNYLDELAADITSIRLTGRIKEPLFWRMFVLDKTLQDFAQGKVPSRLRAQFETAKNRVVRVISPQELDDPGSTFNRRIEALAAFYFDPKQRWRRNLEQKVTEAQVYVLSKMSRMPVVGNIAAVLGSAGRRRVENIATAREIERTIDPSDPNYRDKIVAKATEAVTFGHDRLLLEALEQYQKGTDDPTHPLNNMFYQGIRAWIPSVIIGYARPDLVGKTVRFRDDKTIEVLETGEVIDPDSLSVPSISEVTDLNDPNELDTPFHRMVRERLAPLMEGPVSPRPPGQPQEDVFDSWTKWLLSTLGEDDLLSVNFFRDREPAPWTRLTNHPVFQTIRDAYARSGTDQPLIRASFTDASGNRVITHFDLQDIGLSIPHVYRYDNQRVEQLSEIADESVDDAVRVLRTTLGENVPYVLYGANLRNVGPGYMGYKSKEHGPGDPSDVREQDLWFAHPYLAFAVTEKEPVAQLGQVLSGVAQAAYGMLPYVGQETLQRFFKGEMSAEEYLYQALRTRLVSETIGVVGGARLAGGMTPMVRALSAAVQQHALAGNFRIRIMDSPESFEDQGSPMWQSLREVASAWVQKRRADVSSSFSSGYHDLYRDETGVSTTAEDAILTGGAHAAIFVDELPGYLQHMTGWILREDFRADAGVLNGRIGIYNDPRVRSMAIALSYAISKSMPDMRGRSLEISPEGRVLIDGVEPDAAFWQRVYENLPDIEALRALLPEAHPGFMEEHLRERLRPFMETGWSADPRIYESDDPITRWQVSFLENMGHDVIGTFQKIFARYKSAHTL